ncbi:hypothetical protein F2Q69_00046547 [Brassica cretica]|uniref:CCHC-type domain-containing protein n=1 Tax=Brassica cretica TaxID=69181 RepID=A0A8S9Q2J8_BRACR|nr:hypothetical protein F2Q69_00046547 [Brassica cretica]
MDRIKHGEKPMAITMLQKLVDKGVRNKRSLVKMQKGRSMADEGFRRERRLQFTRPTITGFWHAIKAGFSGGRQVHGLTDEKYTTSSWISVYEESINPISVPGDAWIVPEHVEKAKVLPPESRRAAGRRKKRRYKTVEDKIRSQGSNGSTKGSTKRKCSRCGIEGHNRSTCDRAI